MTYSIILPAYKEAKNLNVMIDQIQKVMSKNFFEIIIVDDYSNDGTREIISNSISSKVSKIILNDGFTAILKPPPIAIAY